MGLDYVEVILEAEKTYGISISDREAGTVRTVGDFHALLCAKILPIDHVAQNCLSLEIFLRLRRALVERIGIERRRVRSDTSLDALLPAKTRLTQWTQLQTATCLTLPPLQTTPSRAFLDKMSCVFLLVAAFSLIAATFTIALAIALYMKDSIYAAIPISLSITFIAILTLCAKLDVRKDADYAVLPRGCQTFRDLIRQTAALNLSRLPKAEPPSTYTREDVWNGVVRIFCEQLRVAPDRIKEDSALMDDLGLE